MTDCRHTWLRQGELLEPAFIIDDWQGPTDAVVRCRDCGHFMLLRLLHWRGRNLATRIFALADLDDQAVTVFLRNMKSAFCDLSRHGAEADMLIATASAITGGVILEAPQLHVLAPLGTAELGNPKLESWRKQAPDPDDPKWLAVLSAHGLIQSEPSTQA